MINQDWKRGSACFLLMHVSKVEVGERGSVFVCSVPGIDPAVRERELMMGMKMPPARAVVEGMAGASRASAAASP